MLIVKSNRREARGGGIARDVLQPAVSLESDYTWSCFAESENEISVQYSGIKAV